MSTPRLNRLLRKWQRILRLQDWTVKAKYVKRMTNGHLAECEVYSELKEAEFQILHPNIRRHDSELTLVHELIHIHLDWTGLTGNLSHKTARGEQAVESMAKAYIDLDRRGRQRRTV